MKLKIFSALCIATVLWGANAIAQESITISGSTSVTEIMEVLGEKYQQKNQDIFVEVQGTGSSAGINAAENGTSMFGMSSRNLTTKEKELSLKETLIAKDGIAVVVNNKNSIQNLSVENIAKIYRGEIKNWAEVGGEKKPIVVVTRDTASGTRGAFEDIMKLKRKIKDKTVSAISQRAQVGHGNGAIKTIVANNPFAIGYISLGSVDSSLKAVRVNGIAASSENVISGDYQVARPFLLLEKQGTPSASANQFLAWITSSEGQKIVLEQGYIPVK